LPPSEKRTKYTPPSTGRPRSSRRSHLRLNRPTGATPLSTRFTRRPDRSKIDRSYSPPDIEPGTARLSVAEEALVRIGVGDGGANSSVLMGPELPPDGPSSTPRNNGALANPVRRASWWNCGHGGVLPGENGKS